jgi:hypothetical protein
MLRVECLSFRNDVQGVDRRDREQPREDGHEETIADVTRSCHQQDMCRLS